VTTVFLSRQTNFTLVHLSGKPAAAQADTDRSE
jgi:hypothetical protein